LGNLQLDDYFVVDCKICKVFSNNIFPVKYFYRHLLLHFQPHLARFDGHGIFINLLQKSMPQCIIGTKECPNQKVRYFSMPKLIHITIVSTALNAFQKKFKSVNIGENPRLNFSAELFRGICVYRRYDRGKAMDAAVNWSRQTCMSDETAIESPDTDAQLMLRFKDGDTGAFEHLFSRHTRAMISFAYRFVRNREMAEELAQEIFLKVYEGAAGYEAQAKFTTWLYRIATNVCLNEVRKPQFRAGRQSLTTTRSRETGTAIAPALRLERQAMSHAIRSALGQLPDSQRVAFILNKYQELSYAEVAGIMGISEKAVKSLIHRAKETLAAKLKPSLPELLNL
jgi:RNA polymerase sigma-70 factor (ECF subfamily)